MMPCANLQQSTYPLCELLGRTPISIAYPSIVVITNLECARSTVYFNLKLGGLSDDERNGTI